jgi:hypothetical protein
VRAESESNRVLSSRGEVSAAWASGMARMGERIGSSRKSEYVRRSSGTEEKADRSATTGGWMSVERTAKMSQLNPDRRCPTSMTERTLCDQLGGQCAADTCAEALADDGHLASITAVAGDNPVPRGPGVKQEAVLGRRAGRIAEAAVVDDEYIDVERG